MLPLLRTHPFCLYLISKSFLTVNYLVLRNNRLETALIDVLLRICWSTRFEVTALHLIAEAAITGRSGPCFPPGGPSHSLKVKEKERQQLREFRAQAGIDAQEHLLVLEKQVGMPDTAIMVVGIILVKFFARKPPALFRSGARSKTKLCPLLAPYFRCSSVQVAR